MRIRRAIIPAILALSAVLGGAAASAAPAASVVAAGPATYYHG
jgi:hypothetical protein